MSPFAYNKLNTTCFAMSFRWSISIKCYMMLIFTRKYDLFLVGGSNKKNGLKWKWRIKFVRYYNMSRSKRLSAAIYFDAFSSSLVNYLRIIFWFVNFYKCENYIELTPGQELSAGLQLYTWWTFKRCWWLC